MLARTPDNELDSGPYITAGLVMGPRGIGTMVAMMVVGKLMGRADTRVLLGLGLGLSAWSFYLMTGWTPDVSSWAVVWVGVIQGVGLGFLFTPLSVVSLQTLPPGVRPEGAGFYNLARNVGNRAEHPPRAGQCRRGNVAHAGEVIPRCGDDHQPRSQERNRRDRRRAVKAGVWPQRDVGTAVLERVGERPALDVLN